MSAAVLSVLRHFGLTQPPFQIAPETRFFFSGGKRMAILQALVEALNNYRGVIQVTGVAGSGKTLTCRMMLERVPHERVLPIYLGDTSLLPQETLQVLARNLNVVLPEEDEAAALHVLRQAAVALRAQGRDVVILVDEAQAMPAETFALLHRLSHVEGDWLFRWVMFGQPELDDILGLPTLSEVRRAVVYKFNLEPLTVEDVARYIAHRLTIAAAPAQDMFLAAAQEIFTPPAVIAIADISLGVPRRINLFAEKALHAATQAGARQVQVEHVLGEAKSSVAQNPQRVEVTPERVMPEVVPEVAPLVIAASPADESLAQTAVVETQAVKIAEQEPTHTAHFAYVDTYADTYVDKYADTPLEAKAEDDIPSVLSDPLEDSGRLDFLSLAALQPKRPRWPYVVSIGAALLLAAWLLPVADWLFGSQREPVTAAAVTPPSPPPSQNSGVIAAEPEHAPVAVAQTAEVQATVIPEAAVKSVQAAERLPAPAAGPAAERAAPAPPSAAPVETTAPAQLPAPQLTGNKHIDARLLAGKHWLETATAVQGSIQLFVLSADNHDGLNRFLARYTSPHAKVRGTLDREQIYLYLAPLKGQMRLGVLYGTYESRQAAADAIGQLPEPLRKLKPYPRSVQGLRDEVGKSQ
ncbi:MAG: hypothetical protein EPO06_09450 [Burkholderiaceae bacterium]|nr:MAG: hypothetical protein EPO06_09450 [Burkholderiaceae bacterium]